jgi:adenosylmethionine-8-amino-7-oxononanoate aminotransferase
MIAANRDRLAAVIIEPLAQGASGTLTANPEEVAAVAAACREHDVLLICDEVAVGFGRTGTMFASEQCGVRPDLLCIGKGLAGGYLPMSATVASGRIFDAFLGPDLSEKTFYHGHSFGGNALAAAVALRQLELFDEWDVLANVNARSRQLRGHLERIAAHPAVADVRLVGLLGAVELIAAPGERRARRVCIAMTQRGVLSRSIGDVVTVVPPLTITAGEIERIVDALAASIDDVCGPAPVGEHALGSAAFGPHG